MSEVLVNAFGVDALKLPFPAVFWIVVIGSSNTRRLCEDFGVEDLSGCNFKYPVVMHSPDLAILRYSHSVANKLCCRDIPQTAHYR